MTRDLPTQLRSAGIGRVLDAGDPSAAGALAGFDTSIDYRPDAVVAAATPQEVERAVAVAAAEGVPLVTLGMGHGMPSSIDGGIVITTSALAGASIDPSARIATIAAGTAWESVVGAASSHGLAAICGSAPTVGAVGYLLGGGIGPLVRAVGVSSDFVRSVELVTPELGAVTASAEQNPDLFWAARGGKFGLGIVTSLTVELLPIETIVGGGLYFATADVEAVVRTFADWAPHLPDSATVSLALLNFPDSPALPAPLRGRFIAHVRYATLADEETAAAQLAPLRAIATPLIDTVARMPYGDLGSIHADPTTPMPVMSAGATLSRLDASAVDALLAAGGPGRESSVAAVEVRLLGAAATRDAEAASAVGARDAQWNLFVSASPDPSTVADPAPVASVIAALDAWRGPENLINFVGHADDVADLDRSWSAAQRTRLSAVRRSVDPHGLLSATASSV